MPSKMDKSPSATNGLIYIGIDPGLSITGYGVLEYVNRQVKIREAGCVRTKRSLPMEERLAEIYVGLNEVIEEFKPTSIIIEDLYSHYRHPKTAIIMGHARGAVYLSAAHTKIPVVSYGATMVKKSLTGNGRASKLQVQHMIKNNLGLDNIPEPPDVADALAVALCHINHLNNNAHDSKGKRR